MKPVPSYFLAGVVLLIVTVVLHALVRFTSKATASDRRRGLFAAIIGEDYRVSTSKLQFVLWTYAFSFVFLALLFQNLVDEVDKVGLKEQYVYLLGIPALGAVGAKLITSTKVGDGQLSKGTGPSEADSSALKGLARGVGEAFSDDSGNGDIADSQYLIFNGVALIYFFVALFKGSADTLPSIPDTLVALTGASAGAYLAKKGVVRDRPVITAVYPSTAAVTAEINVRGANFLAGGGDAPVVVVTFGGVNGGLVGVPTDSMVVAKVPSGISGNAPVVVVAPGGTQSDPFDPFTVV